LEGAANSRYNLMSTLSKETTEALSSTAGESPASQASTQPQSSSQLHSDAVSLEVPLKVHGSKVTEVVRGVTPHTEPFEEETSSMIVFPHGGVLRMSTSVNSGQMLVLTNLKSRQDAICRVVKVRSYSNSSSYVEVEFTHRQPGFWGVYFESDAIAAATPVVTPTPAPEPAVKSPRQTRPDAAASKSSGLGKNESTFIGIGSQEDVQPAASSTSAVPSSLKARTTAQDSKLVQKPGATIVTQPSVAGIHSAPSRAPKIQQEEPDASLASETLGEPSDAADVPASTRTARTLAGEALGLHRDSTAQTAQGSAGKKNWLLVATCGAAVLLAAGGVALFSHHKPVEGPATQTNALAAVAPMQPSQVPATPVAAKPSISKANSAPPVSPRTAALTPEKPPKDTIAITESPVESAASAPTATAKKAVPSILGALNSHPISSRRRADGTAAPSLDAVATPSGDALAGITSSANPSAPAPSSNLRVTAPVQSISGASVPRLLVRVIPQYPPLARQTHTEGDVVVEIAVDRSGTVTEAKVISGPTALRIAALGAVRRWKYEPWDGPSASVKTTATIQFRL
jgi:TonB family protein